MRQLSSDSTENVLHLELSGEVTASDVDRLERDAVLAARILDRGFTLVTDVSDCEYVSTPAAEQIRETVTHLMPFGLAEETHVVGPETPEHVRGAISHPETDPEVELVRERATATR